MSRSKSGGITPLVCTDGATAITQLFCHWQHKLNQFQFRRSVATNHVTPDIFPGSYSGDREGYPCDWSRLQGISNFKNLKKKLLIPNAENNDLRTLNASWLKHYPMGARGFSCTVTGFGQVFIATRAKSFFFFPRSLPETSSPYSIAARGKSVVEERKKRKTFFSHTPESMGSSVRRVFESHGVSEFTCFVTFRIAWPVVLLYGRLGMASSCVWENGEKGDVTRDDSRRLLLAKHSVVTFLRYCFE